MDSSVTVTTASTSSRTRAKVSSPGLPTAMPSAMVGPGRMRTGRPAASDGGKAAARLACTPMILMSGRAALAATARPEISPPPPTAVTMVRTSGRARRISRAMVPWPAMTSGWSNGWISTAPCASA